jgi:DNA-binding Lrp family transcriptional regulator
VEWPLGLFAVLGFLYPVFSFQSRVLRIHISYYDYEIFINIGLYYDIRNIGGYMLLDEKDRKILEMLKQNSRISNTKIARKAGLTEGAVRNRINRFVKRGVISRFTVELTTGAQFAILMAKAKGDTKKMMADLSHLRLTKDAYEISGEYDGCLVLEGNSLEEIDRKIDIIRKLRSVAETRTFLSFRRW